MPYIGHSPTQAGSYIEVDDFGSSFNGASDSGTDVTAFTLQVGGVDITPNAQNLLVVLDGVVQMSGSAYTVSGSTITFTEAPASGMDLYCLLMGQSASVGQGTVGADELKISGNGTNNQLLKTDGDGTFSYINQNTVTASTAATLATARAINGVNFDGSAAITVTADANTLSNTTLKSTVVSSSLTSVGTLTGLTVAHNNITLQGTGETQLLVNAASGNNAGIKFQENASNKWTIGNDQSDDSLFFYAFSGTAKRLSIDSAGDVSLLTAGKRLYIPRASDGALTGSLYSSTGNTITLSGAGSSSGIINFIPSASNSSAVALTLDSSQNATFAGNITQSKAGNLRLTQTATGSGESSLVLTANNSTGDSFVRWETNSTTFCLGLDNSDGDKFILSAGSDPHSNSVFNIQPDGSSIAFDKPASFAGTISNISDTAKLAFLNAAGTERAFLQLSSTGLIIDTDSFLEFKPNNSTAMYLNSSGNVGIGTASPGYQLDLRRNDTGTTTSLGIRQLGTGDASMAFQTTTSPYGFCIGVDGSDSDAFKFATGTDDVGTNTKMTITSAGKVGIGQTTVNAMLDIDDGATGDFNDIGKAQIRVGSINNVGVRAQIGFGWGGSSTYVPVTVGAIGTSGSGYTKADFVINTRAATTDTAPTERLRITTEGDITRGSNDYTSRIISGYTTGNASVSATFPIQDNSSVLVTAVFSHYGAGITSYGCSRMFWLSCRDNSQSAHDISNISSTNGGSWGVGTSSSVVTVTKSAGSYSGGGHYWIKIEGSANV